MIVVGPLLSAFIRGKLNKNSRKLTFITSFIKLNEETNFGRWIIVNQNVNNQILTNYYLTAVLLHLFRKQLNTERQNQKSKYYVMEIIIIISEY